MATNDAFSVGDAVVYLGRNNSIPDMPANFRGYWVDLATGERMARVAVYPEIGPPFEDSVPLNRIKKKV